MDTPPPELASQRRPVEPASPAAKIVGAVALLISGAAAFLLYANGRARGWPLQVSVAIAAVAFVALPVLWHVLAERQRRTREGGFARLLWRCFAVNALLAASAVASLGPQGAWTRVSDHLPRRSVAPTSAPAAPALPPTPPPPPDKPVAPGDGLEAFVPGDATWALRVAGIEALQGFFDGSEAQERLVALKKCHIDLTTAEVAVAARKPGEVMAIVRAAGISDQGNLYCVVGALGNERLVLHFDAAAPRPRFSATGLVPDATVTFAEIAPNTLLMAAPSWSTLVEQRFAGKGTPLREGVLAEPFSRVDRKAGVWAVSVAETPDGPRDIAMQANMVGGGLNVHATAVPPAGRDHMAKLELTLPLAFVRAVSQKALWQGAKGVWDALAADASGPPAPVPPAAR
ncbi:MAG: hypothetical protein SF187_04555 [Deltaproteobacteria bacterium]|nr:hypothetical protein [Deltaproteobacteria bacterium]